MTRLVDYSFLYATSNIGLRGENVNTVRFRVGSLIRRVFRLFLDFAKRMSGGRSNLRDSEVVLNSLQLSETSVLFEKRTPLPGGL